MYRQYVLQCGDTRRVGWINHEPPLKREMVLTLKGDARRWVVEHAGTIQLLEAPDTTWNVGGIIARRMRG